MPKQQRSDVDEHSWELSEWFLECQNGFNDLREDIRCDLKWELADVIQKAIENYLSNQFPQSRKQLEDQNG